MSYKSNVLKAKIARKHNLKGTRNGGVVLPCVNNYPAKKIAVNVINNRVLLKTGANERDKHPKRITYSFTGMTEQSYFSSFGA